MTRPSIRLVWPMEAEFGTRSGVAAREGPLVFLVSFFPADCSQDHAGYESLLSSDRAGAAFGQCRSSPE